jgi:hypothetical protein
MKTAYVRWIQVKGAAVWCAAFSFYWTLAKGLCTKDKQAAFECRFEERFMQPLTV